MSTAALDNSVILIRPSKALKNYIINLKTTLDMPRGIVNLKSKKKVDLSDRKPFAHKLLTNKDDFDFVKSLNDVIEGDDANCDENETTNITNNDRFLNLEDLHWLHEKIASEISKSSDKVYLHELFQGSDILVPKNREIPRSVVLEERCKKLKSQQEHRNYQAMTKNVDNVRYNHPEDTIAYQMKQINTHLIAIAQFIISVLAGFAFGFIGVELLVGNLDFGFRLLLGIICALVIALAELYFLAKKLNEDLEFEYQVNRTTNHKTKVD